MSDKKAEKGILFWLDFETTGLDEDDGEILEYAAVLTDLKLNEIDSIEGVIAHDITLLHMQSIALEMHTKNGLLDAITAKGNATGVRGQKATEEAEDLLDAWLTKHVTEETGRPIIAGSSISFDRKWMKKKMRKLEGRLHYRQLDVSVYKVGFPNIFGSATSEAHRAMPDIRESIKKHALMRAIVADADPNRHNLSGKEVDNPRA